MLHRGISVGAAALGASLAFAAAGQALAEPPLGLPPVPIPEDNPMSPEKVALGERLFNDTSFSTTGEVGCVTCHDAKKAFTDSPLKTSEGINGLTGTRNAPTVVNAAYMSAQFWDGREPDLEGQSKGPFINPVEMGQPNHDPVIAAVRADDQYVAEFKEVFGIDADEITIDHVAKAIAAFERTVISGNSPFDRWHFAGQEDAISDAAKRGFDVYIGQGRCVSCHTISETFAIFTDGRFHNLNVSFDKISATVNQLASAERLSGTELDRAVLSDVDLSELGRFGVTGRWTDIGAFKTSSLRNIAETAPYMHDGSLETLEDVVDFYNNGGRVNEDDPINDFQSSGIRPLNLSDEQKADLVAFLEALTSPEYASEEEGQQ